MDQEKYQAAAKEIKAEKPAENYLLVTLGYDTKLILSHKAGVALLAAMESAEIFKDGYSDKCRITPMERDAVTTSFLSKKEYQQIKIANLLNVGLSEVLNIQPEA